ncbi:MAG: hypothetical protein K6F84_04490 [Lachnospiraceae bacterium]|nr:hypothetical protein [Lachnospiraceae bacterium]
MWFAFIASFVGLTAILSDMSEAAYIMFGIVFVMFFYVYAGVAQVLVYDRLHDTSNVVESANTYLANRLVSAIVLVGVYILLVTYIGFGATIVAMVQAFVIGLIGCIKGKNKIIIPTLLIGAELITGFLLVYGKAGV